MPGSTDLGTLLARGDGCRADDEERTGEDSQPPDRLRLPGLQPALAHYGSGERRAADAVCTDRKGRTFPTGGECAEHGWPRRARRALSIAAFWRSAAARGDREGSGEPAVDPAR